MGHLHQVSTNTDYLDHSCDTALAACSATKGYASKALPLAGIPVPHDFVTADDIENGKPAPDPYLKGAELVAEDPVDCR